MRRAHEGAARAGAHGLRARARQRHARGARAMRGCACRVRLTARTFPAAARRPSPGAARGATPPRSGASPRPKPGASATPRGAPRACGAAPGSRLGPPAPRAGLGRAPQTSPWGKCPRRGTGTRPPPPSRRRRRAAPATTVSPSLRGAGQGNVCVNCFPRWTPSGQRECDRGANVRSNPW